MILLACPSDSPVILVFQSQAKRKDPSLKRNEADDMAAISSRVRLVQISVFEFVFSRPSGETIVAIDRAHRHQHCADCC